MSDGKIRNNFCKMRDCYNQQQEDSTYCIIHYNLRQETNSVR